MFTTRWAMSYLRGPLTRDQIATLMSEQKVDCTATPAAAPCLRCRPLRSDASLGNVGNRARGRPGRHLDDA